MTLGQRICSFVALSITATGPAFAQLMNDNSPWEMFTARLIARLNPTQSADGKIPGFQIVGQPTLAEWNNAVYGKWNLYDFGNRLSKPGEMYSPDKDLTLYGQYKMFIESLDLPPADESKKKLLEEKRLKWLAETKNFDQLEKQRNAAWINFEKGQAKMPKEAKTSFNVWYAREYGPKMGSQEQVVAQRAYDYADVLAKTYKGFSGLGTLVTGVQNKANFMNVTRPDTSETAVPSFSANTDLNDFLKKCQDDQGFNETWTFDRTKERRALNWSQGGAGGSGMYGWFSFGASGGEKKETLDVTKEGIYMEVKFKNFTTVSISPGPWFDGNAIKSLWEGPYKENAIGNKEKLFGSTGSFKQRVGRVVVACRPVITLRLSKNLYNKVVESWNASGRVGIGPFGFNANKSGGKDELTTDDSKNEIVIEDKTGLATVLAVFNVTYPQ